MQAVTIHAFGDIDVLNFEDLPALRPHPSNVLVRVSAAGTNYYDTLIRSGAVSREIALPHVIGSDVVGEIVELGEGVSGWAVGDKVIVAPGFPHDPSEWDTVPENEATSYYPTGTFGWGGYAQEMEVAARWLIRDDTGLAPEELATIPLVLVTAIHAVKMLCRVGPASKVLVQAGASGTGSMAIQVAKVFGAQVVATVSTVEKAALAHRLGADKVIRDCHTNVSAAVRNWTAGAGVDVVIDPVGGVAMAANFESLRPRGTIVNLGLSGGVEAKIPHLYPFFRNERRIVGAWMGSMAELEFGLDLVKQGKVRPALHKALPLKQARDAHRMIASHEVVGKLALLPWAA